MTAVLASPLEPLLEQARLYAQRTQAPNTLRAQRSDWAEFTGWCQTLRFPVLPAAPETVALYATYLAGEGLAVSTIERRLATISRAHMQANLLSPTADPRTRLVLAGIRRHHGRAVRTKAAAVTRDLRAMIAALPPTLLGTRDRAVLLLGFAGAFRRSELVGLDVSDLTFTLDGIEVLLRRSKTDQEGAGRSIGIPLGAEPELCPVSAVRAWLKRASLAEGALLRRVSPRNAISSARLCDRTVARIVKRAAARAGLDPALYAGHSLRAGLATSAAEAGASERIIMNQTGHTSSLSLRRYIRRGELFRQNAATFALSE